MSVQGRRRGRSRLSSKVATKRRLLARRQAILYRMSFEQLAATVKAVSGGVWASNAMAVEALRELQIL